MNEPREESKSRIAGVFWSGLSDFKLSKKNYNIGVSPRRGVPTLTIPTYPFFVAIRSGIKKACNYGLSGHSTLQRNWSEKLK
jgi:hypothetical protein